MTKTDRSTSHSPRRGWAFLLACAWLGVLAAWTVTAFALMGSLGILRRVLMNSEWALDTGRLPQPWVIAVGAAAVVGAHMLFRWVDERRGGQRVSPVVAAWCGVFLGVAMGAFLWIPPVLVGAKVGPSSGMKQAWDVVGWAAYYARLALPAVVGLVAGIYFLFSKYSPLRLFGRRRAVRAS